MKVGFIGTGSMGSLLIDAFIQSGALLPEQIRVSNRSPEKPMQLAKRHPGLTVCSCNTETASQSDLLFLCIKPLEFKSVISEIKDRRSPANRHIHHKSGPTDPSGIIAALQGGENHTEHHQPNRRRSIVMHVRFPNKEEDRQLIESLLSYISRPLEILESHTRITSDFSSRGPAF